jgi:hypothetical protein
MWFVHFSLCVVRINMHVVCSFQFVRDAYNYARALFVSVKLSKGIGSSSNNGAVLMYQNRTWVRVCDTGFTDMSARKVYPGGIL